MLNRSHMAVTAATVAMLIGVTACSDEADNGTNPPADAGAALVVVSPQGGSTNVDPTATLAMEFDGAMQGGMEMFAAMHMGDVRGPQVDGTWTWSEGHTHLGFAPAQPLMPGTEYTMHIGGGMMDARGHIADLDTHGPNMGGEWATGEMMNGGMMTGGMMGEGWQHSNGSYGMVFGFRTAD